MEEIWKPIPGYDGYEASTLGRIRSLDRLVWRKCRWSGKDLQIKRRGMVLSTQAPKDNKKYPTIRPCGGTVSVHSLIVRTFIGDIPAGHNVNHKNGIKSDNRLSNLEVVTYSDNVVHAIKKGLMVANSGEKMLSREDIVAIKFFYEFAPIGRPKPGTESTNKILAKAFKRKTSALRSIALGSLDYLL